jgi:AhpD family alkylhydroperoxidase
MSDRLIPAISPVPALGKGRSVAARRKRLTTTRKDGDMQARIKNPALTVSGALEAFQKLGASATTAGIPENTLALLHLRASQINGCSVCVDMHSRELEDAGESSERMHTVAAWRETPYFSDAERAALALTEAATRLADRSDPVPDEVWNEAARHYSEPQLAALVVAIAAINAFNRVNATTRQISGPWIAQAVRMAAEAA